jgi:hypothetical protein
MLPELLIFLTGIGRIHQKKMLYASSRTKPGKNSARRNTLVIPVIFVTGFMN